MWNHGPEMWGRMIAKKIPLERLTRKKWRTSLPSSISSDIWMNRENPQKGKALVERRLCQMPHLKGRDKIGPQPMGNVHEPDSMGPDDVESLCPDGKRNEGERVFPKLNSKEMKWWISLPISGALVQGPKRYTSRPGDPASGEKLFTQKGCVQCHVPRGRI